jgi:hypothetical protein
VPYAPPEKESRAFFKNTTQAEKIVQEYTGIDFLRIGETGLFTFWRYLHDAVVWNNSQTDSGREYLEKAYVFQQTKPDVEGLKSLLSSKVVK